MEDGNPAPARRLVAARVVMGEEGFVAVAEDGQSTGIGFSSSAAARALGRALNFGVGFDVAYQGRAADGIGTIWHIVELEHER